MAIVNKSWSIKDAQDRGFQFYDVTITDFGDTGAGADQPDQNGVNNTLISNFPGVAVAIAPESVVDRCRLVYNPLQPVVGAPPENSLVLGKEQPFLGRSTAPLMIQALTEDIYGDTFIDSAGAVSPWGGALAQFVQPSLTIRIYLNGPGLVSTGRPRASSCGVFSAFTGGGTEDLIAVIPTHGRKRARISVANTTGASTVAVRICQVSSCAEINPAPPPLFLFPTIETEAVAATAEAGPVTDTFVLDPLLSQYITLYGELTVGGAASLSFNVVLED